MAIVKKAIVKGQKLTKKQLMELESASKMPIVYDENSPELTDEQYRLMAKKKRKSRNANKKPLRNEIMMPTE